MEKQYKNNTKYDRNSIVFAHNFTLRYLIIISEELYVSQVTDSGHVKPDLGQSPKNNWVKIQNLQNSITLRPLGAVWRAGYLGLLARGDLLKNQVFGTVRDDGGTLPHPKERKETDQESWVIPDTFIRLCWCGGPHQQSLIKVPGINQLSWSVPLRSLEWGI